MVASYQTLPDPLTAPLDLRQTVHSDGATFTPAWRVAVERVAPRLTSVKPSVP